MADDPQSRWVPIIPVSHTRLEACSARQPFRGVQWHPLEATEYKSPYGSRARLA